MSVGVRYSILDDHPGAYAPLAAADRLVVSRRSSNGGAWRGGGGVAARWAGTARTVYDGGVRRHSGTIGGVYSCTMLACVMFVLPHPACLVSVSLHPIDV